MYIRYRRKSGVITLNPLLALLFVTPIPCGVVRKIKKSGLSKCLLSWFKIRIMEDITTLMKVFFWIAMVLAFIVGFNIYNAGKDLKNQNLKASGGIIMLLIFIALCFFFVSKSFQDKNATENVHQKEVPSDK